jgi:hypothetical protein
MKVLLSLMLFTQPVSDTTKLKMKMKYDSSKWKVVKMTKEDSAFLKKIWGDNF